MRIAGKGLRQHIRLLTPLFGVIFAVWALRILVSVIPGFPVILKQAISVSLIVPICIILAVVLIYAKGFDGYTSVVVSSFMLVVWGQGLVVLSILFSVLTGIDTVYTAPEFSLPNDPNHTRHILGHLSFGIGLETLAGSLMGCIILFMLRRLDSLRR